jgi:ribosome maturation factor RimP
LANVYEKERNLERAITERVGESLPGVEVLAVELSGPERFTVFVDRDGGVDHALCEQVTHVLWDYLREYSVDVSSPGLERPLRKPEHFQRVVGRQVAVKTEDEVEGRKKFRGTVVEANGAALALDVADGKRVDIPYAQIVRGNLIEERDAR